MTRIGRLVNDIGNMLVDGVAPEIAEQFELVSQYRIEMGGLFSEEHYRETLAVWVVNSLFHRVVPKLDQIRRLLEIQGAVTTNMRLILEELVSWEHDPDAYAGDLADLAQRAKVLLEKP